MSTFKKFMKENQTQKENTTYAVTSSLCDENGEPLLWTIKPLSTRENDRLTEKCTSEVPIKNNPNAFRSKLDATKYINEMLCASVVEPDLNNKELQDSYGVMTPVELLQEMVKDPGEFNAFAKFIQDFNGFNKTLNDKVSEAKN